MNKYGKQIAVIAYGGGVNVRAWAQEYIDRGFVVVYDAGFARIHEPRK